MEVTASPPPALNLPAVSSETEDYEIAQVRAESTPCPGMLLYEVEMILIINFLQSMH